jgi:hypothetical protein
MNTIENRGWIADLEAMTCRNISTRIVVEFQKAGKTYMGKIKEIPVEITERWERLWYGDRLKQNVVLIAEEEFLRAVIERDIKDTGEQSG